MQCVKVCRTFGWQNRDEWNSQGEYELRRESQCDTKVACARRLFFVSRLLSNKVAPRALREGACPRPGEYLAQARSTDDPKDKAFEGARVIDIIPSALSGETNQDSEPFLAIHPKSNDLMIVSDFTPSPDGPSSAFKGGQKGDSG